MFVFLDFGLLYFCVFMTVIKFGEFGSTVVGSMLAQLSSGTDDIFVFLSFYIFVFLCFVCFCVFVSLVQPLWDRRRHNCGVPLLRH